MELIDALDQRSNSSPEFPIRVSCVHLVGHTDTDLYPEKLLDRLRFCVGCIMNTGWIMRLHSFARNFAEHGIRLLAQRSREVPRAWR